MGCVSHFDSVLFATATLSSELAGMLVGHDAQFFLPNSQIDLPSRRTYVRRVEMSYKIVRDGVMEDLASTLLLRGEGAFFFCSWTASKPR